MARRESSGRSERDPLVSLSSYNSLNDEPVALPSRGTANLLQTCANIFKGIVGAGSFALPFAFSNMGIAGGLVVIVIAGVFCYFTVLMLIRCKDHVAPRFPPTHIITYVDIARQLCGPAMEAVVYFLSVTGSLGVSAAYLVFIGSTLNSMYSALAPIDYMLLLLVVLIPLCLLRTFRVLSYTSIIGDVGLAIGLAGTLAYGFNNMPLQSPGAFDLFRIETTPRSFGSVAFLFCVNFMILPIERAMHEPQKFPLALSLAMIVVTLLNAAFGLLAFLLFADGTCSNVVLNLSGSSYVYLVKIALCFDLSASYPLTMAPGREILENSLVPRLQRIIASERLCSVLVRVTLVFVTVGVAQIKTFGQITNLVGGFSLASLAFIVPPIMYTLVFGQKLAGTTQGRLSLCGAFVILIFGLASTGLTTYESVREFFEAVPEPPHCT